MKTRLLLSCLTVTALATGPLFAQSPVGDDDLNGVSTPFLKSELTPTDEVIFPVQDAFPATVFDAIQEHPKFTVLTRLLKETGLDADLKNAPVVSLLAPTDAAFAALGEDELKAMASEENRQNLVDLLNFHVVPANVDSQILTGPVTVETALEGVKMDLTLRETDGDVYVLAGGLARVIALDKRAGNGVVHAIDRVLFPSRNQAES